MRVIARTLVPREHGEAVTLAEGMVGTTGRGDGGAGPAVVGSGSPEVPPPAAVSLPVGAPASRRRSVPVLVLALIALVALAVALALVAVIGASTDVGSGPGSRAGAPVRVDLTVGRGDFTAVDDGAAASWYSADGFHLAVTKAFPAVRGVQTGARRVALGVQVETRGVTVPGGSMFGPFCWQTPTEGYGLLVGVDGALALVESTPSEPGSLRAVRWASGPPLDWSVVHRLRIECSLAGSTPGGRPQVALRASVDGRPAVRAVSDRAADAFAYAGFGGISPDVRPAEWVVRAVTTTGVARRTG